jgi:hypothetical protein
MRHMSNTEKKETVNHPSWYNAGGIEVLDIIHAFKLGFSGGNVIKYVLRAGHKSENTTVEDLLKGVIYLNDMILNEIGVNFSDEAKEKAEKIISIYTEHMKGAQNEH